MDEALALLKAEQQRIRLVFGYVHAIRNYVDLVATFDSLTTESEWESLAEWEKFWSEWSLTPQAKGFLEKWWLLTETGGSHDLWTLID